jgi:uncharacterized membrane protein
MSSVIALIVFVIGIGALFFMDGRERAGKSTAALWIPTAWWFFCFSRSLAEWLGMDAGADRAAVYLEGSPVDRNLLLGLECAALLIVVRRADKVAPILRKSWALWLFFGYATLSVVWSDFPFVTLKHLTKGIGDVLMVLVLLTEPDVPGAIGRIVTRLGFVLLPLSILFVRYFPELGRAYSYGGTPETIGVATQKNSLGELCDCIGLGLLWCLRSAYREPKSRKRRQRMLALGTVLAIVVWLLYSCNSLTSICALCLASTVLLLSTQNFIRRKRAGVHFLVGAVLGLAIYALFFQSSGSLIESLGRNRTLTGRTTIWPQLIGIVHNPLVGVGYESFWLGDRLQQVWVMTRGLPINEAHNGYVEILLTLGWIGECLLLILIMSGYRNAVGTYRADPESGSLKMAWLLAAVITSFTEGAFRMMSPCWIVLMVAMANSEWRKRGNGSIRRDSPT